jgi:hypothetical protein
LGSCIGDTAKYYSLDKRLQITKRKEPLVLKQVAEGVLIQQSGFCQTNTVVVQGRAGVLLIDPGILGYENATQQHQATQGVD